MHRMVPWTIFGLRFYPLLRPCFAELRRHDCWVANVILILASPFEEFDAHELGLAPLFLILIFGLW